MIKRRREPWAPRRKEYGTPKAIKEILDRRHGGQNSTLTKYFINPTTNEFFPKSLPKDGDGVQIQRGALTSNLANNFLRDIEFDADNVIHKAWVPVAKFYVGQIVTIMVKSEAYVYQIRPTDNPDVGLFVLLRKERIPRHPGNGARTSSRGGSKGNFSR